MSEQNKKDKQVNKEDCKLGVYTHYKSGEEYLVLYFGFDEKTKKEVVIYKALYDDFKVWVRRKSEFFEAVKHDGVRVPRFKLINETGEEDAFENKYKRALADYQNLLKQTAKEKLDFYKYANEGFLHEVIPVYDNLKISMLHVDDAATQNGWAQGIKYVIKQFKDALAGMGVEEIKTVGEKFDHNIMEAVEGKGEKVVKEVKAGYRLRDKVIIPAKVVLEGENDGSDKRESGKAEDEGDEHQNNKSQAPNIK